MKNRRRHQKGVNFVEGFFPKGTTLDGFFFIKLSSSSFTILVGSSSLTYLMIAKVNGNRGTHQQRLWVVLLPRPHPKTLPRCITVASRPHMSATIWEQFNITKKKGPMLALMHTYSWHFCEVNVVSFVLLLNRLKVSVCFWYHSVSTVSQQVTSCCNPKVSLPNRYLP